MLSLLVEHDGCMQYVDIINANMERNHIPALETVGCLEMLFQKKYIIGNLSSSSSVAITATGRVRLRALQDMQNDRNSDRDNRKRVEHQAKIGVIASICGAVFALASLLFSVLAYFHIF